MRIGQWNLRPEGRVDVIQRQVSDHRESWGPGSRFGLLAWVKWVAIEDLSKEVTWLDSCINSCTNYRGWRMEIKEPGWELV